MAQGYYTLEEAAQILGMSVDDLKQVDLFKLGPLVENHPAFPHCTNVQFAQVLDRANVRAWI